MSAIRSFSLSFCASISLSLIIIASISSCLKPVDAAHTYSFSVEYERLDVFVLKDGSIDIAYSFGFTNFGYLDGVDIGMPNVYYDLDSAEATIIVDGYAYSPAQIHDSPYIDIGVAVEFSSTVMQLINIPGTSFQLDFRINNPHMVYENKLVDGTVGIAMRPTWFSDDYQIGPTDELAVRVFFPEGFENVSDAVYLEGQPWNVIGIDPETGLLVASWWGRNVYPSSIESGVYDFGVGFPAEAVDSYVKETIWSSISDFFSSLMDLACICTPIIFMAGIAGILYLMDRTYKAQIRSNYFEPSMQVAGAGPRRDLTAVEAAVVLERPLEMVATMILFGLAKKGMVQIESSEKPMRLAKLKARGEHIYETEYIMAINPDGQVDRSKLKILLINLINATEKKLEGFDFDRTKLYYEEIANIAWRDVKEAGTPEEFASGLSENHEWMMIHKNYDKRMENYFDILPYRLVPYSHIIYGRSSTAPYVSPQQLASTYATSVKGACDNVVTNFKSLAYEVSGRTNPLPKHGGSLGPSGSYLRGGGGFGGVGGGGGCACACACACAGGGR